MLPLFIACTLTVTLKTLLLHHTITSWRVLTHLSTMSNSALVLIDLQVDYISGGDLIEGQESTLLKAFPELPQVRIIITVDILGKRVKVVIL